MKRGKTKKRRTTQCYYQSESVKHTRMTTSPGLSSGKSIMVVAVILGCFAILWPKIFYPMFFGVSNIDARKGILFSSLSIQFQPSYTIFSSEAFRGDRPPHLHGIPTGENGKPFHGQELKRTIDKELRVSFAIIGFNSSQVDIFFAGMFFFPARSSSWNAALHGRTGNAATRATEGSGRRDHGDIHAHLHSWNRHILCLHSTEGII